MSDKDEMEQLLKDQKSWFELLMAVKILRAAGIVSDKQYSLALDIARSVRDEK